MDNCEFLNTVLPVLPKNAMVTVSAKEIFSRTFRLYIDNDEVESLGYRLTSSVCKNQNDISHLETNSIPLIQNLTLYENTTSSRGSKTYENSVYYTDQTFLSELLKNIDFRKVEIAIYCDG